MARLYAYLSSLPLLLLIIISASNLQPSSAHPTSSGSAPPTIPADNGPGFCSHSTFTSLITPASPLITDCIDLGLAVLATPTLWESTPQHAAANPSGYDILGHRGTCAFGVRTSGESAGHMGVPAWGGWVGSADVADLIRDSVREFGALERVEARGGMLCRNEGGEVYTEWAIL
ncbi:hypothetical protein DFH27DRAFT_506507, partial [Peziza echinospora]